MQALLLTEVSRTALLSLTAYALWTLLLAVLVVSSRGAAMQLDGKGITDFPSGVPHGGDRYWRLNRAHANATENIGIAAALLLAGVFAGLDGWGFRSLPPIIVAARVVQSSVHIASGSAVAVGVRVTAFLTQVLSLAWIAVELIGRLAR